MKIKLAFVILGLTLLAGFQAQANKGGMDVGGGGTGVGEGSQTFLLDLYDYGFKDTASAGNVKDAVLQTALSQKIDCAQLPCELLASKLVDLENFDPVLAAFSLEAIRTLNWSFTEAKLKSTDDVGETLSDVSPVQIVVRQGSLVIIQKQRWNAMPVVHKAALIFHEAFAALSGGKMTSPQIRRAIATVYSASLPQMQIETLWQILDALPSSYTVRQAYQFPAREIEYHARTILTSGDGQKPEIRFLNRYLLFPLMVLESVSKAKQELSGPLETLWPMDAVKFCSVSTPHSRLDEIENFAALRLENFEAAVALMPPKEATGAFLKWELRKLDSVLHDIAITAIPAAPGVTYGLVQTQCDSSYQARMQSYAAWGKTFKKTKTPLN